MVSSTRSCACAAATRACRTHARADGLSATNALRWRTLAAALTILAAALVASTYRVFSQTYDEPAHLASGIEWLSRGTYHYEAQHPPLERIFVAIGPYLRGARTIGKINQFYEGQLLLGRGAEYKTRLALARLGVLPFFLVLCIATWLWGRRLYGEAAGALSVLFVATNPNLLAHAGLATTDLAPAALMPASLYAYARWCDERTAKRALWFGVWTGLAVMAKFSNVAFLGLALILAELWRLWSTRRAGERWELPVQQLAGAIGVGALVIWATYRFSFGPIGTTGIPVPAPELFRGLKVFLSHGTLGHPAFLLGRHSDTGWWYYFPVAIAVKTPLPILLFAILGVAQTIADLRKRDARFDVALPLIAVTAVLLIAMKTKVDIGIRHVLPLYPFMAVLAARGVIELWNQARDRRVAQTFVGALAASSLYITIAAHPDHIAYFNPLAGDHPERVLVDSNLDWGQDLYRLAEVIEKQKLDSVKVSYFGSADIAAAGVPRARRLGDREIASGWIAASETMLAGVWVGNAVRWLYEYPPVGRIGKSMILFYVPPDRPPILPPPF